MNDISEAEKLEARWPQQGDRLFVEGSWAYDAHVVRDPNERSYRMPMGYKRAGDLLLERAMADVMDRRNVIYAALFCYRQSIELSLKRVIDEFGIKKPNRPKNTHRLDLLWRQFMDVVKERGRDMSLGLQAAQALIMEMDDADRKSDGFRFPTDIGGRSFTFGDRGINLDNLLEVMQALENLFESAYLDFSHQDDVLADMA
jgi:hypothetical protein